MYKRISDEELDGYDTTIIPCGNFNRNKITYLVNDLIDAREALKKYEPEKPSLAKHLQKLANRHCVNISVGGKEIFFFVCSSKSNDAEAFFNFDRNDFEDDCTGCFVKPEVTDE